MLRTLPDESVPELLIPKKWPWSGLVSVLSGYGLYQTILPLKSVANGGRLIGPCNNIQSGSEAGDACNTVWLAADRLVMEAGTRPVVSPSVGPTFTRSP